MGLNLAQKLIRALLVDGESQPDAEIALEIDQVLLQDVLGVPVTPDLGAFGLHPVKVDLAAQLPRALGQAGGQRVSV